MEIKHGVRITIYWEEKGRVLENLVVVCHLIKFHFIKYTGKDKWFLNLILTKQWILNFNWQHELLVARNPRVEPGSKWRWPWLNQDGAGASLLSFPSFPRSTSKEALVTESENPQFRSSLSSLLAWISGMWGCWIQRSILQPVFSRPAYIPLHSHLTLNMY